MEPKLLDTAMACLVFSIAALFSVGAIAILLATFREMIDWFTTHRR